MTPRSDQECRRRQISPDEILVQPTVASRWFGKLLSHGVDGFEIFNLGNTMAPLFCRLSEGSGLVAWSSVTAHAQPWRHFVG